MNEKQDENLRREPVPMKYYGAWEVGTTPPNCVPRLCTLKLTHLTFLKAFASDTSSINISVRMKNFKHILRSSSFIVPNGSLLDTQLDLTFSLQYPHYIKNNNLLHIMLQKSKHKNSAMLGFKTLAVGEINLTQVLQRCVDNQELELLLDKDKNEVMARLTILSLSSQPIDHDESDRQKVADSQRVAEVDNFTDEEYSSNEEGCDSEPTRVAVSAHSAQNGRRRSHFQKFLNPQSSESRSDTSDRNIKQKFAALLKKFRVPETESFGQGYDVIPEHDPKNMRDLFDESEDVTDSEPDMDDDASISSAPKPGLRPFFSSGTLTQSDKNKIISELHEDSLRKAEGDNFQESGTDQEHPDSVVSSPPRNSTTSVHSTRSKLFAREKSTSTSKEKSSIKESKDKSGTEKVLTPRDTESSPRKIVLEQLAKIFPSDETIPEHFLLVSVLDGIGLCLARLLQERQQCVVATASFADLRASLVCLVNKIQKFCYCNSRAPSTIRIGVLGQDSFVNSVVRLYVELFSTRPPEWQNYIRFFIVPLGIGRLGKYFASVDDDYEDNFVEQSWKDILDNCNFESASGPDAEQAVSRILNYLTCANSLLQLPIAEAMITFKDRSSEDDSSPTFIPFVTDVNIGIMEGSQTTSVDLEEQPGVVVPGSSPPGTTITIDKVAHGNTSPPNSPNMSTTAVGNITSQPPTEAMDLHIDYWTVTPRSEMGKKPENKFTLKSTFITMQVSRLPASNETSSSTLILNYITKEKKKIKMLTKKKDPEGRYIVVDSINRFVCLSRNVHTPLTVTIDGVDWTGVKFFQLTSQWQTHIKYFPVNLFRINDPQNSNFATCS
ncbi:phosphofurin acidic cluster sorting protein 1-like [Centruroides sculpturatus]|uniref:phosphofurin acidic cluster sorting protein 1-like n=1 Tax=Centruroides sculpturatus TaxID=218467 RepID=UPI000C6C8BE5|nr:phosphofurin acidic cluster sorting protein 1-like [Centruroides sculpturatus]